MTLGELAPGIKCRNAGASWISIDLPFGDIESFRIGVNSITQDDIARIYGLEPEAVRIYPFEPAMAIKITLPRATWNGGIEETDFDGAQQFAPLLDLKMRSA